MLENFLKDEFKSEKSSQLTMDNSFGNYFIISNILIQETFCPVAFVRYEDINNDIHTGLYEVNQMKEDMSGNHDKYQLRFRDMGFITSEIELYKIARATSAAGPFFRHIEIQGKKFVDGGFSFNNPAELAYEFIQKYQDQNNLLEIYMLSLGCTDDGINFSADGFPLNISKGLSAIFKLNKLASQSVDNTIMTNNMHVNKYLSRELRNRYFRISPDSSSRKIPLDGISEPEIRDLKEIAKEMISSEENKKEIENILIKIAIEYDEKMLMKFLLDLASSKLKCTLRFNCLI